MKILKIKNLIKFLIVLSFTLIVGCTIPLFFDNKDSKPIKASEDESFIIPDNALALSRLRDINYSYLDNHTHPGNNEDYYVEFIVGYDIMPYFYLNNDFPIQISIFAYENNMTHFDLSILYDIDSDIDFLKVFSDNLSINGVTYYNANIGLGFYPATGNHYKIATSVNYITNPIDESIPLVHSMPTNFNCSYYDLSSYIGHTIRFSYSKRSNHNYNGVNTFAMCLRIVENIYVVPTHFRGSSFINAPENNYLVDSTHNPEIFEKLSLLVDDYYTNKIFYLNNKYYQLYFNSYSHDIIGSNFYFLEIPNNNLPVESKDNEVTFIYNNNCETKDLSSGLFNPTRNGYKFIGWYEDGKRITSLNGIDRDIILIAQWEELNPSDSIIPGVGSDNSTSAGCTFNLSTLMVQILSLSSLMILFLRKK